MDKKPLISKYLAIGIVLLFLGTSIPVCAYSVHNSQFNGVSAIVDKNSNLNPLAGDKWMRIFFGHDVELQGHAIQTSDGGFLLVGYCYNDDSIILIKTNSRGIKEWKKSIGENKSYFAATIKKTSNDTYVIVGSMGTSPNNDLLLIKIDSMGNVLWEKTIDTGHDEICYDFIVTNLGDILIVGGIDITWYSGQNLVVKTDSEGNMLWAKTYVVSEVKDYLYGVDETAEGGFIITGTFLANGESYVWLIRTTVDGDVIWDKKFNRNGMGNGVSVQQTSDNGFIIGAESSDINFRLWVLKIDNQGNMIWNKTYGVIRGTYISSVKQTSDNGFIICGYIGKRLLMTNGLLIKTDSEGNKEWSRTYSGLGHGGFFSVEQTTDGGYILGGDSCSCLGFVIDFFNSDLWLVKTDKNGRVWSLW
jgi:hypothetical protein